MAGKSTRDVSQLEPSHEHAAAPAVSESRSAAVIAPPDQLSRPLEVLDETDWEVSYVPLKTLPAPVNEQTLEVPHG